MVGKKVLQDLEKDSPLMLSMLKSDLFEDDTIDGIKSYTYNLLLKAKINITPKDKIEISCHYGLHNFCKTGAVIIDKINRSFCKKIIVMAPDQTHPTHHHIRKEEAFELLYGDCTLILNKKKIKLQLGKPIFIAKKVNHSFSSSGGCILEEVSTTHYNNDSVYEDPAIDKLEVRDRKVKI